MTSPQTKAPAIPEYPQDIVKKADDVCRAMDIASPIGNCLPVMEAILAERERCARTLERSAVLIVSRRKGEAAKLAGAVLTDAADILRNPSDQKSEV